MSTVKPVLSGHSKRRSKNVFQDQLSLNAGQSIAECLSILQYFQPSLSYHLSLRPLFCLFLCGRLRQESRALAHTMFFHLKQIMVSLPCGNVLESRVNKLSYYPKLYTVQSLL